MSHPQHDGTVFDDVPHLIDWIHKETYHGGIMLLQATCKKFTNYCIAQNILTHDALKRNFTVKYDTNIPRQVY